MGKYGFPWPSMLDCDKFPVDNDMCIASREVRESQQQSGVVVKADKEEQNENNAGKKH